MGFKHVVLVLLAVVLTLALMSSGISFAFSRLTDEQTLRSFVTRVSQNEGASSAEANAEFDDLYYREFACPGVVRCVIYPPEEGAALVLISNRGHAFFTMSMYLSIVLVILCIVLIFFVGDFPSERLLSIGIPCVIAGMLVLLKPITQGIVLRAVPPDTAPYVRELLVHIFTVFTFGFLVVLLVGLVLTLIGALALQRERTAARERKANRVDDNGATAEELRKEGAEEVRKQQRAAERAREEERERLQAQQKAERKTRAEEREYAEKHSRQELKDRAAERAMAEKRTRAERRDRAAKQNEAEE